MIHPNIPLFLDQVEMNPAGASMIDRSFLTMDTLGFTQQSSNQPSAKTVRVLSPEPLAMTETQSASAPRTPTHRPFAKGRPTPRAPASRTPTLAPSCDMSDSEHSSSSESIHPVDTYPDSDEEDMRKIEKPLGEVGRPGRGGYNLEAALDWPRSQLERVKRFIKTRVLDDLDCTVCFSDQPLERLASIRQQGLAKFPFLANYRRLWVVDDIIRCRLKYEKAEYVRKKNAKLASEVQARKRLTINIPPSKASKASKCSIV
ncbi:hypothetical protein DFH05DRAFT_1526548 [Lentinula detonsa]|uniref:Uncharacterized protein n=1 Tax=Lentinula detonsa TaxID=2804962 RepID=A0A9W8NXW7_9AGAR|nr:hypothetical protein DFH05DRAFT_1526548 [Lentinula detonsa]